MLRGKFIASNACIRKEEKSQMNKLSFHFKKSEMNKLNPRQVEGRK